ncbi:MAG TPA: AtpZ/AtpI family protein [Desulfotomaculum sp.]|nr:AtpZ/AtpI family protein [Desulfotomaculum sp.]
MFAIFVTSHTGGGNNGRKNSGLARPLKAFALASTIAVQFAVSVFIGALLGSFLDKRLGTDPWLMLGGLLMGIVAGMVGAYRMVSNVLNNKEKK